MSRDESSTFSLVQPIAVLLRELDVEGEGTVPLPVNPERALATGIFPLTVTLVESTLRWLEDRAGGAAGTRRVASVLRRRYRRDDLAQHLEELYVARDALVHSHVWEEAVVFDPDGGARLVFGPFQHLDQMEERRFRRLVDPDAQATKTLGLPVLPFDLTRADIAKFVGACLNIIRSAESAHHESFGGEDAVAHPVSEIQIQLGDEVVTLPSLVRRLGDGDGV